MFSTIRGCLAVFFALRGCLGRILGLLGMLPCFDPIHCPKFRTGFWLGNKGNLDFVLHRSCTCNCDLDVRLLNHQNWISIAQVMVHFIPGIVTVRLG